MLHMFLNTMKYAVTYEPALCHFSKYLAVTDLRIDNGDYRLIGLRFKFWLISMCLYGPFECTICQIKAEILSN